MISTRSSRRCTNTTSWLYQVTNTNTATILHQLVYHSNTQIISFSLSVLCLFFSVSLFLSLAPADSVNIKILNAGAWSRSSEKVFVSLPTELEDLIPEVEDFYKRNHSGRKLHWHHLMSNGIVSGRCAHTQQTHTLSSFSMDYITITSCPTA